MKKDAQKQKKKNRMEQVLEHHPYHDADDGRPAGHVIGGGSE